MRESMIIYRSFYEAIKELEKEDQADVWRAIFEYGLNFKKPKLKGIAATVWMLIEPQIAANIRKYENGLKPKGSKREAKGKQNGSETEGNVNDNVTVNENKEVYRSFAHLSITRAECRKLFEDWTEEQINTVLDDIENWGNNKNVKSLYLTARKWLTKDVPKKVNEKEEMLKRLNAGLESGYYEKSYVDEVIKREKLLV
jgi:hypothetical protein